MELENIVTKTVSTVHITFIHFIQYLSSQFKSFSPQICNDEEIACTLTQVAHPPIHPYFAAKKLQPNLHTCNPRYVSLTPSAQLYSNLTNNRIPYPLTPPPSATSECLRSDCVLRTINPALPPSPNSPSSSSPLPFLNPHTPLRPTHSQRMTQFYELPPTRNERYLLPSSSLSDPTRAILAS